ncbi:unnamed protein product [Spirodela intermedia]|uniref:Knottins-like domain-containing protein n=1 Tax=Spirodela intermedia TaxID=51605 RepID=A0A7I8KQ12_SPIIN|nr:unnamed protein product [Spirodela intermedia]
MRLEPFCLVSVIVLIVSFTRICESRSQKYRGTCLFSSNCAIACKDEKFTSGYCTTISRACICTKPCC